MIIEFILNLIFLKFLFFTYFKFVLFELNLLLILFFSIFIALLHISIIPKTKIFFLKRISLFWMCIFFLESLFLWINFQNINNQFLYIKNIEWLSIYNIYYTIGVDGISLFFIILTTFLFPICVLTSWESISYQFKKFVILLLLTELILLNVFMVLDLFFFIYFLKVY